MGASQPEHVSVVALDVIDQELYAAYRAHMQPSLQRYGGRFEYDLAIAQVLKQPGKTPFNRLFTLIFPSKQAKERCFADPSYLEVRRRFFDPAVAGLLNLGEYLR